MPSVDPFLIAKLDFSPVPPAERHTPGRVKSVPARMYLDKFQEHREAWEFLQEMQDLHGEGGKTVVRALLHYRDSIINPLEQLGGYDLAATEVPAELLIAKLDFQPLPARQRSGNRVKHVSVRLYIDKFQEHREAYQFLQQQQDLHGEGLKTLIRAIIHYRDTIVLPMREIAKRGGQMRLSEDN